MSFSFFKVSRPKTPQEVVKSIKESLVALDTKTVVEVKALEKALEEVEKNFVTMRTMLSGDGESEPNLDQVSQLVEEIRRWSGKTSEDGQGRIRTWVYGSIRRT
ncbi:uncharacterized protein LOC131599935 [Vicia villosa]|uniref:uncharacterized protein LOC131599935 n=1 Tax=Vicia villosa TaxID=3911 RepID=UPI00273CBE54|nr:uncharacterized protein LOC131599935 [Vicia villosa]